MENLTTWFKAQIGTAETPPGSNRVKYNTDYYGYAVSGDAYPWCVTFIWDGFRQCGMSVLFCGGIKTAYCPYVVDYARKYNLWVTSGYREGDLLLYDWDKDGKADHIGYCSGVSGNNLLSIEGNASNAVREMTRAASAVMGAYRPKYTAATKPKETSSTEPLASFVYLPALKRGDKGDVVRALQILLIGRGYTVGGTGVDGDFGNATHAGLVNYQQAVGLEADGVAGCKTWQKLLGV